MPDDTVKPSRRTPGRIFINYRRDDAGGVAGRLSDSLNRYFGSGRVFRDVDGIDTGADFEDVLKRKAQDADAMIVLIGHRWVTAADGQGRVRLQDPDDWVAREIVSAIERRIPVYPVLVESAVMPRADELPQALRPLVRYNAMSLSDHRWQSDVTRLAKVVAIDIPGSAAERTLLAVQWVVSLALLLAVVLSTAVVAWNGYHRQAELLSLAQSGIAFVVITACATVLLFFARFVDVQARRWVYAAAAAGLFGTLLSFLWFGYLGKDDARVPISVFFGSTVTATAMLVIASLSRFKAR